MLCFLAGVKSELAHGTPSEINTYISMNNCTKFGALIRSITIQPLSNPVSTDWDSTIHNLSASSESDESPTRNSLDMELKSWHLMIAPIPATESGFNRVCDVALLVLFISRVQSLGISKE